MSKKLIPTPHIELDDKSKIAKTVIMPGDPLRAKFIAEKFLDNIEEINSVRNMLGYTGTYKGKKISVMGSGMGMPSIGIYSFELYSFYDVETIIRVGSAGAYTADLKLYDVVLTTSAFSESTFAKLALGSEENTLNASSEVNEKLIQSAEKLEIPVTKGKIHSSDVFYRKNFNDYKTIYSEENCICVEMESFALFANAKATNKKAACLLTISDSLVTSEATSSQERQNAFINMIKIALEAQI